MHTSHVLSDDTCSIRLDQLAPPPLLVLFGLRLPPVQIKGVAFCHSRLNDFSPSSSSPGSLFSSLCLSKHQWTIPIKLFPSKTVDELQEFFFRMQFVTEHNPLGGWMGVIHTDQSSVWLLHKKYSYCTMQVTVQRVNVY